MTFGQLLQQLSALSKAELDLDATVHLAVKDEYLPCSGIGRCEDGVLDDRHPFIEVQE